MRLYHVAASAHWQTHRDVLHGKLRRRKVELDTSLCQREVALRHHRCEEASIKKK
jgi:hypothetical protein